MELCTKLSDTHLDLVLHVKEDSSKEGDELIESMIKQEGDSLLNRELILAKEIQRLRGAQRLQAELDEEARFERERKEEASKAANTVEWDDNYEMERKKHFARLRAEEQRRKLLTKAQRRNQMSNYLKNMARYTLQQLRGYSFNEIKTLFETTMRKVNTFVPIKSEVNRVVPKLATGSSKRDAEEELDQESSKRQRELIKAQTSKKGIDIYMLVEKEYPLSRGTLTLMLVAKLLVDQDNEMSRELLRKIFMQVEKPRR
ncbi:hypothetical protein Tco_0255932 [Tanacetum coccineum]